MTPHEAADVGVSEHLELLRRAEEMLRMVNSAVRKMGLKDKGDDLRLPHEVRMLAFAFSDKAEPKTPERTILAGDGSAQQLIADLKAAQIRSRLALNPRGDGGE